MHYVLFSMFAYLGRSGPESEALMLSENLTLSHLLKLFALADGGQVGFQKGKLGRLVRDQS